MNTLKNSIWKLLFPKEATKWILALMIGPVISGYLGVQVPIITAKLYSEYGKVGFQDQILALGLIFLYTYFNRVIFNLMANKYVEVLVVEIRKQSFTKWLKRFEVTFEQKKSDQKSEKESFPLGEVISRVINDTEASKDLITSGTFGLLVDLFFVISSTISLIFIQWRAGVLLIMVQLIFSFVMLYCTKFISQVFLKLRVASGQMAQTVANLSGGIGELYYTPHKQFASTRSKKSFNDFLSKQLIANFWDASYFSLAEALYPIFLFLLILFLPETQIKEAATLAVVIDLIQRSIGPIKDVAAKVANIQRAKSGLLRIHQFLNYLEVLPQKNEDIDLENRTVDKLKVNIPSFEYPKQNMREVFKLKNILFEARQGEVIGVIGKSGSGKSTLFKILSGDLIPATGEVRLEGKKDQKHWHMELEQDMERRSQIYQCFALVSQDSHLFSASLHFNITLDLDEEERFSSFWEKMKEEIPYLRQWGLGPQDQISKESVSQGQAQLICALRACFLQRPVILLDEISSALDSQLELALSKLYRLLQRHSLTLIIAHRVETLVSAKRTLVFENGQMVALGPHQELMRTNDIYQSFFKEANT